MSFAAALPECEAARRVGAVCRLPEAGTVQAHLAAAILHPPHAAILWLTWVQWRALGREQLSQHSGLSLWTLTDRLRQLREAGVPVISASQERDLFARGRFHGEWHSES